LKPRGNLVGIEDAQLHRVRPDQRAAGRPDDGNGCAATSLKKRSKVGDPRRHHAARRLSGGAEPRQPGCRKSTAGATEISERHRHRYEVNTAYKDRLEQHGLRFSGAVA